MADGAIPAGDMDGSVFDAAAAMAAIPGLDDVPIADPMPTQTQQSRHPADASRAANGQFRSQGLHPQAEIVADVRKAPAAKLEQGQQITGKAGEPDADGEAADDVSPVDDEYFELPPEKEGGEPVRLKATEVWEKAQRADSLAQRVAELEKGAPPPEAFDHQLMQLVNAQTETLRRMQAYEQMLQPTEPDMDLIDESSPRYDPGKYQRQMAIRNQQAQQIARIRGQAQEIEADRQQRMSALEHLQRARGREALGKIWPEVVASDGKEATRVRSEVADYYGRYGVTPEVMASITNPGFYAVLKDALAYRRGLKDRETAVKVVRSKPKLVRGSARNPSTPQQQAYNAGMQRLTQSHTVEDAAAALRGLI